RAKHSDLQLCIRHNLERECVSSCESTNVRDPQLSVVHHCLGCQQLQCHADLDHDQPGGDLAGNLEHAERRHGHWQRQQQLGHGQCALQQPDLLPLQQRSAARAKHSHLQLCVRHNLERECVSSCESTNVRDPR